MGQKKGMKLLGKFLLLALLPLFVMFAIAQYAISAVSGEVAEKMVHNMLSSNAYMMNTIIKNEEAGGFNDERILEVMTKAKEQTGGVNFALIMDGRLVVHTFSIDVPVDTENVNKALS